MNRLIKPTNSQYSHSVPIENASMPHFGKRGSDRKKPKIIAMMKLK
jgi:hypothetical protein